MYIDKDEETILETLDEIEIFSKTTSCQICKHEAMTMIQMMQDAKIVKLAFSTTCEHQ